MAGYVKIRRIGNSLITINNCIYKTAEENIHGPCYGCYFNMDYAPVSCNLLLWREVLGYYTGKAPINIDTGKRLSGCLPRELGLQINKNMERSLFLVSYIRRYENNK